MSRFVQIHLILIICYIGLTTESPVFQGIKVQKGFEIELKPLNFKPLTFFREKWSPLGVFGARKGIYKRDLSILVNPIPPPPPPPPEPPQNPVEPPLPSAPAPVHEALEEVVQQPIQKFKPPVQQLAPGPDPVNPGLAGPPIIKPPPPGPEPAKPLANIGAPNIAPFPDSGSLAGLSSGVLRPQEVFYTNIGAPLTSNLIESPREMFAAINGELPPRAIGPLGSGAPLPPPLPGPLPPQPINPVQPIQAPPMNVVPLITPPVPIPAPTPVPPEIPPKEGPLVRGSRIAMYLGSTLVKMVSQFLANAKLQLSQFAAPAPTPVPPPPNPGPPPIPAVPVMPLLN